MLMARLQKKNILKKEKQLIDSSIIDFYILWYNEYEVLVYEA